MQSVEVTIKGTVGEPMVLVFAASDTPETVSERLRMLTWIVRQVDEHGEPRRRAARADRAAAAAPAETPAES